MDQIPTDKPCHRPTYSAQLTKVSIQSDLSPSPFTMYHEGLGVMAPHMASHQHDAPREEAVTRWVDEWQAAPYVPSVFHPSPSLLRVFDAPCVRGIFITRSESLSAPSPVTICDATASSPTTPMNATGASPPISAIRQCAIPFICHRPLRPLLTPPLVLY